MPQFNAAMPGVDLKFVEEAVARIGRKPEALIPILQALQEHHGYLPEEALERLARIDGDSALRHFRRFDFLRYVPPQAGGANIFSASATARPAMSRERGGWRTHCGRAFDIPPGADTDAAREFTIEQVACLGCCTLAPVVKMGD